MVLERIGGADHGHIFHLQAPAVDPYVQQPLRKEAEQPPLVVVRAGEIRVLLAHPASVGYGLNLQDGGHVIVWYGLTWSLELYQQANARLYRQGQEKPVIIHHLVAVGTVDEQVRRALKAKDTSQAALLAALKERRESGQQDQETHDHEICGPEE